MRRAFVLSGPLPVLALTFGLAHQGHGQERIGPRDAYTPVTAVLEPFIAREVEAKGVPALSIALLVDQEVVWARGFGMADASRDRAATAGTVYRAGSVSKLFTDVAVMQLVEAGRLELDAPVDRYLPEFAPRNPWGKPITLRQLMAHRAGLVREPPVGHYFDPEPRTLAETVKSLNATELVYEPGTRTKYSNAGIAVVGYVLERVQAEPFAAVVKRMVLDRLGTTQSGFVRTDSLANDLARATMWTVDDRSFPAPEFALGTAPAGNLYATVTDLTRLLAAVFADGRGNDGRLLKPETLRKMLQPQFAGPNEKALFGLGFALGELEGKRRIGHGGAVYGFATELAALPDEKLGVAVCASKDCANGLTDRVADKALSLLLAHRQGKPLPVVEPTAPVPAGLARRLTGRYEREDRSVDLVERDERLFLWPSEGGPRGELRALGDRLVVDDAMTYGPKIETGERRIRIDGRDWERVEVPKPAPAPARWAGLIGEYGWDHNVLYILEKEGQLHALIEWFFLYPLDEVSANVYRFPRSGLYNGEKLIFTRDARGRATQVEAASVVFRRRPIPGEDSATFQIKPLRPPAELRAQALEASPPKEPGEFRAPELVDLTTLDPTIKLEIRYASTNNFMGTPLYSSARAFLQRPAAEALLRAHRALADQGYGLLIHDAYRPWYVTKMFWEATPPPQRIFVANPAKGSRHNRGAAVNLTLYDRKSGAAVPMVGGYDEFSDRSNPGYPGGTALQRWHRERLRHAMEAQGFTVNDVEWWHFDFKDWQRYPIGNVSFEQLDAAKRPASDAP